jgi:hypothetical protein
VPKASGILCAEEVASMVSGPGDFEIPYKSNVHLKICVGIHSGKERQDHEAPTLCFFLFPMIYQFPEEAIRLLFMQTKKKG